MKITALSLTAPTGLDAPRLTPELLASVFAKYSRSNEGIDSILSKVDLSNPEESIARILKFVDYGHASIGGMAAGLAVAIDGLTMFAAYKMFELSPMSDGQESSTRYIALDKSGLPKWGALGFDGDESAILQEWAETGLNLYARSYSALDAQAARTPEIVRIPEKLKAKPSAVARLRKNYALDRARYFLPFALRTNMAVVQSARCWVETITGLLSSGAPELNELGNALIEKLTPYAPNLMRHARVKGGWTRHTADEAAGKVAQDEAFFGAMECQDSVAVSVFTDHTDGEIAAALAGRDNRYDRCGIAARDTTIRCSWKGMAVAELRDLNRHRTGSRFSALNHCGFYIPKETEALFQGSDALSSWDTLTAKVAQIAARHPALRGYTLSLGSQVDFKHTAQADKYVYTTELRTGMGAHFRYARHYGMTVQALSAAGFPLTAAAIQVGEAEPE